MSEPARDRSAPARETGLTRRLRQLAAGDLVAPQGTLSAQLAQEIDEIMLPRILSLLSDGRVVAEFHVAQRALVHIDRAGTAVQPRPECALDFAQALLALERDLAPETEIRLCRRPAPVRSSATRCLASQLQQALATLTAATPQEALRHVQPQARAMCFVARGSTSAHHSDPTSAFVPALEAALAEVATPGPRPTGAAALGQTAPTLLCLDLSRDLSLVVARQDDGDLALILPRQATTALQQAWCRALS